MDLLGQVEPVTPDTITGQLIGAAAALIILTAAALAILARKRRVNRIRAARGTTPLSFSEIERTRMPTSELGAASDQEVDDALETWRQREWERQLAAQEIARHGRAITRGYCATHDRWCKTADSSEHPPGGWEIEPVPPDWKPAGEEPMKGV